MGNKSKLSLESSIESFMSQDMNKVNKTMELEHIINNLQKSILNYLLKLSKRPLDDNEREIIDLMFNTVNDIERIGDHAENIAELSKEYIDDKLSLSSQGKEEIKDMYKKVLEGMDLSLKSLEKNDKDIARNVLKIEEEVNAMNKSFRANHMIRLNQNNCDIDAGIIYLDFLSNL